MREPLAVRPGNHQILPSLDDERRHPNRLELEPPRACEGEVVVDPAVDAPRKAAAEAVEHVRAQLAVERGGVDVGEEGSHSLDEPLDVELAEAREVALQRRPERLLALLCQAELDDVPLAHSLGQVELGAVRRRDRGRRRNRDDAVRETRPPSRARAGRHPRAPRWRTARARAHLRSPRRPERRRQPRVPGSASSRRSRRGRTRAGGRLARARARRAGRTALPEEGVPWWKRMGRPSGSPASYTVSERPSAVPIVSSSTSRAYKAAISEAAARSGCRASAPSSRPDRSPSPHRSRRSRR